MLRGTARDIVVARGGVWHNGRGLVRCPLPDHGRGRGDINPSLSIAAGERQTLLVHCFAGCDSRDVLRALGGHTPTADTRPPSCPAKESWQSAWEEGWPLTDTPAATYLCAYRQVGAAERLRELAGALRFQPTAPFSKDGTWRVPGLMAAVQNARGRVIGLQVTGLRQDGLGKVAARKTRHTFGRISGGAVRLDKPGPGRRARALAVAEGVETALGFARLSGYACWASLGASLVSFVPPDDIDELVIAADHDAAGLRLASGLAERLAITRPSLFVEIRHPAFAGRDWADEAKATFSNG